MTTADHKRNLVAAAELNGVYKLLGKLAPTALVEIIKDLHEDGTQIDIIDRARQLLVANVGEVEAAEMLY